MFDRVLNTPVEVLKNMFWKIQENTEENINGDFFQLSLAKSLQLYKVTQKLIIVDYDNLQVWQVWQVLSIELKWKTLKYIIK